LGGEVASEAGKYGGIDDPIWAETEPSHGSRPLLLYRAHEGNFAAWRRLDVVVDGEEIYQIADCELLEIPGNKHRLCIKLGDYSSQELDLNTQENEVVVCQLSARGSQDPVPIRLEVVSVDDLQHELLRFDRPPYSGGRVPGLVKAFAAITAIALFGIATLIASVVMMILMANPANAAGFAFVAIVGTLIWLGCAFIAASGVRGMLYYYRLPEEWRH
jgi:hypothetical protein